MKTENAISFLEETGQNELINNIKGFPASKKKKLLKQILQLAPDWPGAPQNPSFSNTNRFSLLPLKEIDADPSEKHLDLGIKLLAQGKAACLILAGGLGTRLHCSGPKGALNVSPIKKKSLFQIHFESILALQNLLKRTLSTAVLVSTYNQKETFAFLKKKNYFGLKKSQIDFLLQKNAPCFDLKGNLLLNENGMIVCQPNGNGGVIEELIASGLLKKWMDLKIEYVHVFPVDNPFAHPFDPSLIGATQASQAEAGLVAILRDKPLEKIGIIARQKNHIVIKDYTELSSDILKAKDTSGGFKYALGNPGLYCFKTAFLHRLAKKHTSLPVHWIQKKITIHGKSIPMWKAEKFVLDLLEFSQKTQVILQEKKLCFAPLKSLRGYGSLKSLQKAYIERDRFTYEKITGIKVSKHKFELSADFYYPSLELIKSWKGKALPKKHYITHFLTHPGQ